MTQQLNNKVVLITGAGSGLGAATARAFADAGCRIAAVDIRPDAVRKIGAELSARDTPCQMITCDVSDAAEVFHAVSSTIEAYGRLDIIVNNAAIDHTLSVEDMSIEQWDQVIDINLRGPFLFAKAAMPAMKRQNDGHFINVASTAATRAWANAAAYHASKWGLVGFGRGLGVEGRPYNIRVTTVIPGGMQTNFFDRFVEQGISLPDPEKLQDPANVAAAIVFAAQMPPQSVVQELIVTPRDETSWP